MCGPLVMEAVREKVSRRDVLRLVGAATVAAVGSQMLGGGQVLAAPMKMRATRVQDLTHTLTPTFPSFSGQPVFKSDVAVTVKKDGFYALNGRPGTTTRGSAPPISGPGRSAMAASRALRRSSCTVAGSPESAASRRSATPTRRESCTSPAFTPTQWSFC